MALAGNSKVAGWVVLEGFSRASAALQMYIAYAVTGSERQPIADLAVVSESPLWNGNP